MLDVWYLFRSRTQPAKPSEPLFLHWIYMILPFRKTWYSWSFSLPVLALIFDNFGIDFGSILAPLWHQNICFGVIVFCEWNNECYWLYFYGFWQKNAPKNSWRYNFFLTFSTLFPRGCFKVPWLTLVPFWFLFGSKLVVLATLFDNLSL